MSTRHTETLKFGEESLPIHFGLRAINQHAKNNKFDFNQMVTTQDAVASLDDIVELITTGLNDGARRADTKKSYTVDEVWDMCEEYPQAIIDAADIFGRSINVCIEKLNSSVGKNV